MTEVKDVDATVQEILDRIDNPEPIRTLMEISLEISTLIEASSLFQAELEQLLGRDRLACLFWIRDAILSEDARNEKAGKSERISGFAGFSDESSFPSPSGVSKEDLEYFEQRAAATHNPVLAARYDHLAYALASKKAKALAQAAIDNYFASAQLFIGSSHRHADLHASAALDQAIWLASEVQDPDRLTNIITYIAGRLRSEPEVRSSIDGTPLPVGRHLLDLSKLLIFIAGHTKFGTLVTSDLLDLIENKMVSMADQNGKAGMHFLNHQLLELARSAADLRKMPDRAYELTVARIEELVKQAETTQLDSGVGPLISGKYYEDAINEYELLRSGTITTAEQRAKLDDRLNELRIRLKSAYRFGRENGAYGVIPVDIDIKSTEVDAMLADLLADGDLNACLDRIVSERCLLPNTKAAYDQAKEAEEFAPLQAMIPRIHVAGDIPVSHAVTDEERLARARDQYILLSIQINAAAILVPLFQRLVNEKGLNPESLVAYFERWGLVSEQDLEFLRIGFDHYFDGDHASALHLLIPRYESILRGAFEAGGIAAHRSRRTQAGSESETLGAFLSKPSVISKLPDDLREYIILALAEQSGWNLRNRIAHGLIRLQECTALESTVVIHLLLLLTLMRKA